MSSGYLLVIRLSRPFSGTEIVEDAGLITIPFADEESAAAAMHTTRLSVEAARPLTIPGEVVREEDHDPGRQ
jgi:hypothetical protein